MPVPSPAADGAFSARIYKDGETSAGRPVDHLAAALSIIDENGGSPEAAAYIQMAIDILNTEVGQPTR